VDIGVYTGRLDIVGELKDRWKLRIGAFRIIYAIDNGELVILVIDATS